MNWEKTTIGEHCTVTSSKRFHLSERSTSGVPFYCSKEIIQKVNGHEIIECDYIREELYEQVKKQFGVPKTGDLLITTRGTYGVPYIYSATDRFYFADGNLTWLKDFDKKLLPEFLLYWVKSHEGQGKIDAIAKGTAQKAVPIISIKALEIPLPQITQQKRIIDILSAYDNLIENNQKQIKLLEEAAQRLHKEWFVDLRFPGYETTPVVDGVPEGWHQGTLEELISINYGKDHKQVPEDGEIPVYGSRGPISKCNKFLYTGEAVLIPRKGSLNHIMYVNEAFWTVDTMFYATMKKPNTALFVYFFISSFDMYAMNIGAAVPSMTVKILEAIPLLIPSENALKRFDDTVKVYFQKIAVLNKQIEGLAEARDRLLPKLMSGEIEV